MTLGSTPWLPVPVFRCLDCMMPSITPAVLAELAPPAAYCARRSSSATRCRHSKAVRVPHGVSVAVVKALAAGLAVVSEMITFDAAGKALISSSVSRRPASFGARCWRVRKPTWVLRGNATLIAQQVPGNIEARYRSEEAGCGRHGRSIADDFIDWGVNNTPAHGGDQSDYHANFHFNPQIKYDLGKWHLAEYLRPDS